MSAAPAAMGAPAAPGPLLGETRLMILKMVLENFKSYGGVKEIGPFHKCFSSVVGPNGSGKSNVIDAMLFVFGKRASKMRLNKVSELIHKSAEYPDLDYARVTVYFQEIVDDTASADAYTAVAGSQFSVTRTAHRSNASKYFINERAVSMTEVTTKLKARGIDLDNNRFLILQGEVEQIAMMKPKGTAPGEEGMLEYLEDIIGSNVYVERIAEAEAQVESLSTLRDSKLQRVKVLEKERSSLESAKLEAEALLKKQREVLRLQAAVCHKAAQDAADAVEALTARSLDATAKHAADAAKLAEAQTGAKDLTARYNAAVKANEEASSKFAALTEKFQALDRRFVKAQEDAKHAKANMRKLQATIEQSNAAAAEARATAERAALSLPQMEANLSTLETERTTEQAAYDAVLATLKGETEGLRLQMEAQQALLTPAAEAAANAAAELEMAKTELRLLREQAEAGSKEHAALATQLKDAQAGHTAKQAEHASAVAEHAAAGARRKAAGEEAERLATEETAAVSALNQATSKVRSAAQSPLVSSA